MKNASKKLWVGFKREMRAEWYFYFCRATWLMLVITWMIKPVDMVMASDSSKWAFLLSLFCEVILRIGKSKQLRDYGRLLTINRIAKMLGQRYIDITHDEDLSGNMPLRVEVLSTNQKVLNDFEDIEAMEDDFKADQRLKKELQKHLEVKR